MRALYRTTSAEIRTEWCADAQVVFMDGVALTWHHAPYLRASRGEESDISAQTNRSLRSTVAVGLAVVLGCTTDIPKASAPSVGSVRRETALDSVVHIEDGMLEVPSASRLDSVPELTKSRVEIGNDIGLYVIEEGTGPALVLISGGPGNTLHSFLPFFREAADFSRVIFYDQRGTGLSDWKPGPAGYSTSQAVEDLEALRQALGVDQWYVLGHSYGGLIAQWYALRFPERLLGLILVGSSVPVEDLDLGERDYRSAAERRRIRSVYSIDGEAVVPVHSERLGLENLRRMIYNGYVNGDWKRQYFYKPDDVRMAQIARYEWVHDRGYNQQMRADGFSRDLAGMFRDFPVPTLIVEGAHDANWGPNKPEIFVAEHTSAELVVLDRSAHFPFAEQPAAFFAVLKQFVDRHAAGDAR